MDRIARFLFASGFLRLVAFGLSLGLHILLYMLLFMGHDFYAPKKVPPLPRSTNIYFVETQKSIPLEKTSGPASKRHRAKVKSVPVVARKLPDFDFSEARRAFLRLEDAAASGKVVLKLGVRSEDGSVYECQIISLNSSSEILRAACKLGFSYVYDQALRRSPVATEIIEWGPNGFKASSGKFVIHGSAKDRLRIERSKPLTASNLIEVRPLDSER